jgi:hypothetical protein
MITRFCCCGRSLARSLLDISASVALARIITIRVSSFCLQ